MVEMNDIKNENNNNEDKACSIQKLLGLAHFWKYQKRTQEFLLSRDVGDFLPHHAPGNPQP